MKLQNRCRIFFWFGFFLLPISLIAQSEEDNQKLKTKEKELK